MDKLYKILNIIGIVFALWFALTSWSWIYYMALIISYPFGLISLLIFFFSPAKYGKEIIKFLLAIGLIVSMIALLSYR